MTETTAGLAPTQGWIADDATFGARLALIRQRMGWGNIAMAARECGVPTDSWRNWETDGREPHRIVTIAMAIAARTGADVLWLVHGPTRGAQPTDAGITAPNHRFADVPLVSIGDGGHRPHRKHRPQLGGKPVRQTRPLSSAARPMTPLAV